VPAGTAKRVIFLNMQGGMSPWESFDPKEGNGPAGIITSLDSNISISEWFPKTAGLLPHCLILRNVGGVPSHVAEHTQHARLTGFTKRATIDHPDIGAWIKYLLPRSGPYVNISSQTFTGAGFLPPENCGPVIFPTPHHALSLDGSPGDWQSREELQTTLIRLSPVIHRQSNGDLPATRLFASEKGRETLQWDSEPAETKQRYGDHDFGKGCLLARRLAEKEDAVFIEVALAGWDAKGPDYFPRTKELSSQLDDGFSALVTDLIERKMLESTLIVIATDYGRRASIEDQNFREFSADRSCAIMAGGGVKGGTVYGETAEKNGRPLSGNVSARQFNALIARALSLDPFETVYSPDRRPFTIGDRREDSAPYQAVFGAE